MKIIDTKAEIFDPNYEAPRLKIGEKLYPVNDKHSAFKKAQEILNDKKLDEDKKNEKLIDIALGKKAREEIMSMDLTAVGFSNLTWYIMSAMSDTPVEELKAEMNTKK